MKTLAIIDYGAGNVTSLQYALDNLEVQHTLTANEKEIRNADLVIFPGVGHARQAMEKLKESKLDQLIPTLTQPTLGICIGMQLMCNHSEEGNQHGLGIFDVDIKKMKDTPKLPHMGWNQLIDVKGPLLQQIPNRSYMYFVHSYCADEIAHTIATVEYSQRFSAVLQRDNFYATQFHPEKSGTLGIQLLKNFIALS